ncbi:TolC family protein [Campylobacter sp. RM16192]|uniref:TolC family protein n=1 Tax=Campylobacter sp. RM16192 TaxID=1660080 RepID=UPI0014513F7C|nr:TolC family protein [Campylobacter sp. RM16192]QCD53109.1 type I secretion system, outer membrane protein, TolC family [Campylobacter sp. RM16192]
MKNIVVVSMLAATSILFAQDMSYRIYMSTVSEAMGEKQINRALEKVRSEISSDSRLNADIYVVKGYKVLYVDTTPVSKKEASEIFAQIKKIPGYEGSLMRKRVTKESDSLIVKHTPDGFVSETVEKLEVKTGKDDFVPINMLEKKLKLDIIEYDDNISNSIEKKEPNIVTDGSITLSQVIKTILEENPGFKETEFAYMKVGKDLKIANNAYYPTLDFHGTYGYVKDKTDDGINAQTGKGNKATAGLTFVENIYNGGADKNRIISQNHRLNAAAYSVVQKADRLSLQVISAYLEVIRNKELLNISKANVKTHEEIYEQIKDRTDSGFARSSEERQAGSRLTLAQANLVAQENNYYDSLSTFEKLYGKRVEAENLTIPSFDMSLPVAEYIVYEKAMRCNPTLLLEMSNIKMNESVVNEKKAPFRPRLDFEASASYEKNGVFYDDYKKEQYDVLLRLRYNIFNKNIDKLEQEKSKLAVTESMHSMENVKRDLSESLKFSWQTYILNEKKIEYLERHVEYSKDTLDSYRDEFRIGRRDLINLLDAESEYNNALTEIINTKNALLYSKYRLLDNMGMLTDSFEPGFSKKYIQGACSIDSDLK